MNAHPTAVIGAGLAGLACARVLADAGEAVLVFDKARGAGGRMSTRRTEVGAFDHGAQYFTARDPAFVDAVAGWRAAGVVDAWAGRIGRIGVGPGPEPSPGERYVGTPGMSSLLRHLAADLDVRYDTRVVAVAGRAGELRLTLEGDEVTSPFRRVVVATPSPQAATLLAGVAPAMAERVSGAHMAPCWSVLAAFEAPLPVELDGVFFVGHDVGWAARDNSKPGRAPGERWIVHGHWDWSSAHLDDAPDAVAAHLLAAFFGAVGLPARAPSFSAAHRWRYALPVAPLPVDHVYDAALGVGVCGDWCDGPRVEGAWLSGRALGLALRGARVSAAATKG